MQLSNDLLSQFAKVTNDSKPIKQETTVYGTIKEWNGGIYVQLDGSDLYTPYETTMDVKPGERVSVKIKDHTATVTGNITSPAARVGSVTDIEGKVSIYVDDLNAATADIKTLVADNVKINERLVANEAVIDVLDTTYATIENLNAANAKIDRLDAGKIDADVVESTYATIESLEATNAEIRNLDTVFVTAEQLIAMDATIKELDAKIIDTDTLDANYANIDFGNIGEAAITSFFTKTGMIENVVIGDSTVTGALVGVTIKGDLIEANTLKADKLVIKGDDGIYYKLNFESGKFKDSEAVPSDGLDGRILVAKSVTAEQISVKDLVAFGADIGGFKIDDNAIRSVAKGSPIAGTRGIYMDNDGQFATGDDQRYLRYYKDTNGNYKLEIAADSIKFGTDKKTIETALNDNKTIAEEAKANATLAQTAATNAQNTADEAAQKAQQAEANVTTAQNAANEAKAKAEQAEANLATAQANLATVTGRVDATEADIAAAQEAVNKAQTDVDAARADVNAANQAAQAAQTAANTANTNATAAQEAADKAQEDADAAKEVADKAASDVKDLTVRVVNAETSISQTNEAIELKASKTELTEAVDAIDIGGRNYLYGTTNEWSDDFTVTGWQYYVDNTLGIDTVPDTNVDIIGRTITFSGYINNKSGAEVGIMMHIVTPDITAGYRQIISTEKVYAGNIGFVRHTFSMPAEIQTVTDIRFSVRHSAKDVGDSVVQIKGWKLERGSKPTDWTPAIEESVSTDELEENYYTKAQTDAAINVSAGEITSTVEGTYATKTALSTEIANTKTLITQTANGITSEVSSTYATKTEVDNLEIGAANLIQNSDFMDGTNKWEIVGVTASVEIDDTHGTCLKITSSFAGSAEHRIYPGTTTNFIHTGGTYSLSFYARADVATSLQSNVSGGTEVFKNYDLTTSWKRYTHTYDASGGSITFWLNNANTTAYITKVQVERGDKVTDWSLALADVSSMKELENSNTELNGRIDGLDARVAEATSAIQQLSDSISMFVTDGNGSSLMTQTENGWTFNIGTIESAVNDVTNAVDELQKLTNSTDSTVTSLKDAIENISKITERINVGTYTYVDDEGVRRTEPSIEWSETDTDFKLIMTNTQALFMDGPRNPTKINTTGMITENMTVQRDFRQGDFVWAVRSIGNYGLMWKGAGE